MNFILSPIALLYSGYMSYNNAPHLCFNSTIKFPKSDALDVFDK